MLKSHYQGGIYEAGVDEVGRGCIAGPVVAAAVVLPSDFYCEAIKDSKKLSASQRKFLAQYISKHAISYGIGEASVEEIEKLNILQASFLAMHRAIAHLTPQPELLLIDGNYFKPYQSCPHVCIIKGDSQYLSIAAASILAKEHRDNLMKQYALFYPGYEWERNVGYPTKSHRKAIATLGITPLHRKSFQLLPLTE
ncbi:MAG: ribonuclease HII [Cytophagales bacterium]|nr:ribonuclease HII [Cytophagales bacterium]MDW8383317.1 ribonuclease HII [Flammeovirgaceae bacterium]